eukprot:GILI01010619.1.p1 GENE.GILI01010619.1~~GILI01010619.1.p1  ORF type:complete len:321 (+),score=86.07 GILI01010619.1:66-965(+)
MLKRDDDVTSTNVVELLSNNKAFECLSVSEGKDIQKRDAEDDVKLAVGVNYSISKGVIDKDHGANPPIQIDVVGKSADDVANNIMNRLPKNSSEGSIVVLVGLSGTGKGTTVKKLQAMLPKVITWSNGNAFRSLTHLIATEVGKDKLTAEDVTPALVKAAVEKLSFEQFTDKGETTFDVVIDKTTRVANIQNTTLKTPLISCNVPTVAEQTQGEVILFARKAVEILTHHGFNVILEGRAQTLNYIPTEYRFELVMPDVKLLGQRRAAQRIVAHALHNLKADATDEEVAEALKAAAEALK